MTRCDASTCGIRFVLRVLEMVADVHAVVQDALRSLLDVAPCALAHLRTPLITTGYAAYA
jgi:hypothetical protein